MAWPLRRKVRMVWWVFVTAVLCALPFTVWEFKKQHWRIHWQGWFIGGLFVLLSLPISAYEVAMHLEYWSQPALQKHVIRILLMVPIYAVDSWFALRFSDARFFITPVRECYEAFVIYNFYRYLVTYLEINVGNVEDIIERKPQQPHLWPFNLIVSPWPMGWKYSWECKKGIYNYVILRPLTSIVALIARKTQVYDEGQFSLTNVWTYTAAINNLSQAWAVYCLIMFGMVLHEELAPLKPLWKFITIKLVVFFSFWQGFVIEVMIWFNIIRLKGSWTIYDSKDVASGLQDFLVCVECFGYAILFAQAFPPRDYMTDMPKGFLNNLVQMLDVRDVVVDLTDNVVEDFQTATTNVVHASNQAVALPGHALKTWLKKGKPWFKGGGPAGRRGRGSSDEDDAGNQQLSLLDGGDLRSPPSDQPGSSRAAGSAEQLDGEDGELRGEGDAGVSGLGLLVSDVPGPLGGPSSAVALRPASSMGRAARTDDRFS